MTRLTKNEIRFNNRWSSSFDKKFNAIYNKLKPLEDIEEELGIDLVTLFSALKNGIYVWNNDYIKDEVIKDNIVSITTYIQDEKNRYELRETDTYKLIGIDTYEVKDYGKTWSLTKEELKNDK